jgi:DNA (cytosine-5)-methyltransferase 1
MNPPPLTAISLFSGCGGDTLGLERAGFKVLAFNEFNNAAVETHKLNFPDSTLLYDSEKKVTDITKLADSTFEPYKGRIGVVFAGFPCQGFSHAGKKKATDPRNQLFRQFVRVVKIVRPRFFIGENVTGLTSMKSGPSESDPPMLEVIMKAFRDIGYEITYKVLEAVEYGVPQKRKRLLLVGHDTSVMPTFDSASFWANVSGVGHLETMPKLRSFVEKHLQNAHPLKSDEVPTGFSEYALPIEEGIEVEGTPHPFVVLKAGEKLLSCSKRISPIHSEIIDLDAPSKTVICTYDHQPRLLVGLRKPSGKSYVRCLTPDELKQIQGFPSSFKLHGNMKEKIVQVGNAVPPALVYSVAASLRKLVEVVPAPVEKKKKSKIRIVASLPQ